MSLAGEGRGRGRGCGEGGEDRGVCAELAGGPSCDCADIGEMGRGGGHHRVREG